jgi:hypothetical protein
MDTIQDTIQIDNDPRNVKINVPRSLQAHYQRTGLIAAPGEWFYSEGGTFSLSPRDDKARDGKAGRRRRNNGSNVPQVRNG